LLKLIFDPEYKESVKVGIMKEIASFLKDRGITEQDVWIDVLDVSPVPKTVLIPGDKREKPVLRLYVGKKSGFEITFDGEIDLLDEGMPLMVIFRTYVNREKYSVELEPLVSRALESSMQSILGLAQKEYEEALNTIIQHVKSMEHKRITM
ncbi:MAG: metal-dependent phosphohydrolase, partial [Thermosphaera sp.]